MSVSDKQARVFAKRILDAAGAGEPMAPLTDAFADFDLAAAYRVLGRIVELRQRAGEQPIGWKIGFTNRTIWEEYGVHAPIWGPIYDSTVMQGANPGSATACSLQGLAEPRIEPEIAFRLASTPHAGMEETELLGCIDAVAHGCEVVQSIFPGWRFKAADTVAAFALHGRYVCGPLVSVEAADRARWLRELADFRITLSRGGKVVDTGAAANVLGGPLSALRALVVGLEDFPLPLGLRPGDLVTTGTITRAFPVHPGERWRTEVNGLPVAAMDLAFS